MDTVGLTIKETKEGKVQLKIRRCGPRKASERAPPPVAAAPVSAAAPGRPAPPGTYTALANETTEAAVARGMRADGRFEYRGVVVGFSELPDADTNLLFGNALWPGAETLAKLLIDEARGGASVWTAASCAQIGVPLDALLLRRFGVQSGPPPSPGALESLCLDSVLPDVSAGARVLEVGAGVGVTGLACHALGADVILTDGEQRLVDALSARHGGDQPRLAFACDDWHEYLVGGGHLREQAAADCDVILGAELLNPSCEGEIYVPRVIGRRLRRARGARALLLGEVRRVETCRTAVAALLQQGLRVAAFRVCHGRELFEVALDVLAPVGSSLLLVASWGPNVR